MNLFSSVASARNAHIYSHQIDSNVNIHTAEYALSLFLQQEQLRSEVPRTVDGDSACENFVIFRGNVVYLEGVISQEEQHSRFRQARLDAIMDV